MLVDIQGAMDGFYRIMKTSHTHLPAVAAAAACAAHSLHITNFGRCRAADLGLHLQVQQPVSEADIPTAEVVIGFRAEGMAPETLSLRLRPGCPHSLELESNSPFVPQVLRLQLEIVTQNIMPPAVPDTAS